MSLDGRGIHGLLGEKAPEAESQGERGRSTSKEEGKKKATKEEGVGRKRKAEREAKEAEVERSCRGEATKPNAASQCVSETDCKNRNCKMCNCRALLGWTNAGIADDVSGRSIPSRPRLPPLFSPWIPSNSSSKGSLGETGPRPCPEGSFERNPVRGTEEDIPAPTS